jgi:transcription elongation factor Elf1
MRLHAQHTGPQSLRRGLPARAKRAHTATGVPCPHCSGNSQVIDSRLSDREMRRRRVCLLCGMRFTTYEKWREDFVVDYQI